jgi:hypothetical protein
MYSYFPEYLKSLRYIQVNTVKIYDHIMFKTGIFKVSNRKHFNALNLKHFKLISYMTLHKQHTSKEGLDINLPACDDR